MIDVTQISAKWWFIIFPLIPILSFFSISLDRLFGVTGADFSTLLSFRENIVAMIPFALFLLLFGPVPEEFSWRGYALNDLEKKMYPFTVSILLGVYWTVWHIP